MGRKRKGAPSGGRPNLKLVRGTGGKEKRHEETAGMPESAGPELDAMAEQFAHMHQELLNGVSQGIRKASRGRRKEEHSFDMVDPYTAAAFEALTERLGLEVSRTKRGGKYTFTVSIAPRAAEEILLPFWKMVGGMLERQLTETTETFIAMAVHGEVPDASEEDDWDLEELIEGLEDLDDDDLPL